VWQNWAKRSERIAGETETILCIAKIKNARIGFRGDYFQRMGIGLRASGRTASGGGLPAVLRAELAVGMWLFVALKETNRRVQFFRQKLTQAASV
jgi:hypothetical protein